MRKGSGQSPQFFKWNSITNLVNHKRYFGIECQNYEYRYFGIECQNYEYRYFGIGCQNYEYRYRYRLSILYQLQII